jgi:anti-sigma28 factor (negative regulator of flagellin synthesis)
MKNSQWFLTASLAAVIAFTSLSVIASADEGEFPQDKPMHPQMEEVKAAIESGDYNAFAEVAPEHLLEKINADNFGRFQEMHNHMEQARAIGEELGLERGPGMDKRAQMKGHMMENREEIKAAVENGDYNAWVELHEGTEFGSKILEHINEENFSRLGDLHEAIQNQDFETAKTIKAELGLPDRAAQGQKEFARNR